MAERSEKVSTSDGTMDVFIAHPDGQGPWPVIVQLMDGLGMREELRDHARRTAEWGYFVLAPDLYYRFGLSYPLDFSVPKDRDDIMAAIGQLTAEKATLDILAALEVAQNDRSAKVGKIGLYGFCMGGKLSLELCETLGERVAASASIHPGNLVTASPRSPHLHLGNVKAELYFGIAGNDAGATPEQMQKLEAELVTQEISYLLDWYPEALHGFMISDRPELYNRSAAESVRARLEDLFYRKLVEK